MEIKIINEASKMDIKLKNEPFALYGRMIPSFTDEQWNYKICLFSDSETSEMCFPDDEYDYDAMKNGTVFIGAYDNENCIGLAVLQDYYFKYMYLNDLKVSSSHRHQGVGQALIEKAKEVAVSKGYKGIYTVGQDNNLNACKFYIKSGFRIGGFDNCVYSGTSQEGKADILFYLDC